MPSETNERSPYTTPLGPTPSQEEGFVKFREEYSANKLPEEHRAEWYAKRGPPTGRYTGPPVRYTLEKKQDKWWVKAWEKVKALLKED